MVKLPQMSLQQAPMALAQGLVPALAVAQGLAPALLGPLWVPHEEVWYPNMANLALMSPQEAPMAVALGLVPALLGPMGVVQ